MKTLMMKKKKRPDHVRLCEDCVNWSHSFVLPPPLPPSLSLSLSHPAPTLKQYTIMVIKPDAVQAGKVEEIVERVKSQGMEVIASKEHTFTKEEAAEFYKQHEGSVSPAYNLLVHLAFTTSTFFLPRTTLKS